MNTYSFPFSLFSYDKASETLRQTVEDLNLCRSGLPLTLYVRGRTVQAFDLDGYDYDEHGREVVVRYRNPSLPRAGTICLKVKNPPPIF